MQLLRELVPTAKRIAVLVNPIDRANDPALRDVESAAIGQQVLAIEASTVREIDAAFERLEREKVDALFVSGNTFFNIRRVQLAVLAARYAIPATYSQSSFVEAGGLMSYGTDLSDTFRQVGLYAARILKGAQPADLPVMQATKFVLAINLNTARALRFEVPPTLSGRRAHLSALAADLVRRTVTVIAAVGSELQRCVCYRRPSYRMDCTKDDRG